MPMINLPTSEEVKKAIAVLKKIEPSLIGEALYWNMHISDSWKAIYGQDEEITPELEAWFWEMASRLDKGLQV